MTPATLPNGQVGVPYPTQTFTPASGFLGIPPPGFAFFPIGSPATSCTMSGTPTQAGTFTFTLIDPLLGPVIYTLIIAPAKRRRRALLAPSVIQLNCRENENCPQTVIFQGVQYQKIVGNTYVKKA